MRPFACGALLLYPCTGLFGPDMSPLPDQTHVTLLFLSCSEAGLHRDLCVHSAKTFSKLVKVFIKTFVAGSPSTLQTSQMVIIVNDRNHLCSDLFVK